MRRPRLVRVLSRLTRALGRFDWVGAEQLLGRDVVLGVLPLVPRVSSVL
jgi:hypothetical protein